MKKKVLLVFIILFIIVSVVIIYLNKVILPTKIKSLVVSILETATQKKVSLESLKFNLFKGLVLKNLVVYDGQTAIVSLKEGSCAVFILPIFQKKIIIPIIKLKSPMIFLERKKDSTFNIHDLFVKRTTQASKAKFTPSLRARAGFAIFIYKVSISDGSIRFQDDTLSPAFTKNIESLDLILNLSLPASVKFTLKSEIPASAAIKINAAGEYKIPDKELISQINIKDFSPKEFQGYYRNLGISIPEGTIEAMIGLNLKDNIINAKISGQSKDLVISKDKISAKLNSQINADLKYSLINKELEYSVIAAITKSHIAGLEVVDRITDINGQVQFNNSGVFSDKLMANIWAIPVEAKLRLTPTPESPAIHRGDEWLFGSEFSDGVRHYVSTSSESSDRPPKERRNSKRKKPRDLSRGVFTDFKSPLLNIDLGSSLDLNAIAGLFRDKFKVGFPGDIQGKGNLFLKIETRLPAIGPPQIKGSLDIINAILNLEKPKAFIEDISGRLEFDQSQLKWPKINFKYLGLPYKTAGVLTDFKSPAVQLELSSKDLSLESSFVINQQLIKLSKLEGQYLNSRFSIIGDINTTESSNLETDVNGQLNINLQDIKEPLAKMLCATDIGASANLYGGGGSAANYSGKDQLERIRPEGMVDAQFKLKGNINELKSCTAEVRLSSSSLSLYGLKAQEFSLNYSQADGLIDISGAHLSLYDGTIEASARMNLNSENLPFWLSAGIQGVKLEKLKADTAAKEKDIAGTVSAHVKINGFPKDISKLSGAGQINITGGKLWQMNLFKGLGTLLFVKDFSQIIFNEGSSEFSIQDKYIFTDNLKLKSNIADLAGSVKIGFDGSISALLNIQVLDERVPLTGTFKDITQAIIGHAGRFGAIKISGTLEEPKYKFQGAIADIIKGLKNSILKNIFE